MFGEKKKMRDLIELARVFAKLTQLKMSLDHVLAGEEEMMKKLTLFVSILPDETYFSDIGSLSSLHESTRRHVETMKKRLAIVRIVGRPSVQLNDRVFESIPGYVKKNSFELNVKEEKRDEIAHAFMEEYIYHIAVFIQGVAPYFYESGWKCSGD